jgi:Enoyl-CoA hydratase/isomerase
MDGQVSGFSPDFLTTDRFSAIGDMPVLVVDAATYKPSLVSIQSVIIGIDVASNLPSVEDNHFDLLITTYAAPTAPWVHVPHDQIEALVGRLSRTVATWPQAAAIMANLLRTNAALPFEHALLAESLAYSTLLGGSEFQRWLAARLPEAPVEQVNPLVTYERNESHVRLSLNAPSSHNAMNANMRDALYEGLAGLLDDPSQPTVSICAKGRCFSVGGALDEFGTTTDLAKAHVIRTTRNCAALVHRLGERAEVVMHDGIIGSGLEIAAAAHRRLARRNSWFQLPELRMGLIPGAGGTVTLPRAIGRHRTMWLYLTGTRLRAAKALEWGLVHALVD